MVDIQFRLKKCMHIIHIRFQRNKNKITSSDIINFCQVILRTIVLDMNYPSMADIQCSYFFLYIKCFISNVLLIILLRNSNLIKAKFLI